MGSNATAIMIDGDDVAGDNLCRFPDADVDTGVSSSRTSACGGRGGRLLRSLSLTQLGIGCASPTEINRSREDA